MSQDELLVLIYQKDEKAFTYLYDNYAKSLFSVISVLIKNTAEAEAVLQEVFVKTWNNIDSYNENKGRFYTWILTIARQTAMERAAATTRLQNPPTATFVKLIENSNKVDGIGIQDFSKRLKPKCIQIIDLLFFKGYTQQETADELAIPVGTVKTHNQNCITDLRNYLKV